MGGTLFYVFISTSSDTKGDIKNEKAKSDYQSFRKFKKSQLCVKARNRRPAVRSSRYRKHVLISGFRKQMRPCTAYGKYPMRSASGPILWNRRSLHGKPSAKYARPRQPHGIPWQHARSASVRAGLLKGKEPRSHSFCRGGWNRHPRMTDRLSCGSSSHGSSSRRAGILRVYSPISHIHGRRIPDSRPRSVRTREKSSPQNNSGKALNLEYKKDSAYIGLSFFMSTFSAKIGSAPALFILHGSFASLYAHSSPIF